MSMASSSGVSASAYSGVMTSAIDPGDGQRPGRPAQLQATARAPMDRRRGWTISGASAEMTWTSTSRGLADHSVDHRALRQLGPTRALRRAEDDLRAVLGAGEAHEGIGDVGAGHLGVAASELLEQRAMAFEELLVRCGEAVGAAHVDADQLGLRAGGQASASPHEPVAVGRTGEGDDDTLAGLPRRGDAVPLPVLLQALVDAVRDPQQRQLAQCAEVADPEVVGQRGVDLVGGVHVAVGHAPPQRLRRHVDELDLVGGAHDRRRAPSRAARCR